jgi:CubicO group peptidase (beta-lactamase class C family)
MHRISVGVVLAATAALVTGAASLASGSAGPQSGRIDQAGLFEGFDFLHAREPFSGTVLVVRGGKVLGARSYGYADRRHRTRARLTTRYRVSDLTQLFTWIGLLQLSDRRRLSLDRSVCRFFRPCPPGWQSLTTRLLMGSRSGLPRLSARSFGGHAPSLVEYVDQLRRRPLGFKPGSRLDRGGGLSADITAARLLELASKQSWTAYMQRHVLGPGRMSATGFGRSRRDAIGYGKGRNGRLVPLPLPAPTVVPPVDLGLWSTAGDFAKLDQALASGRLLSARSLKELATPTEPGARGWSCCFLVTKAYGHRAEADGAHGFGDGFYTVVERFPDDHAAVFVFTNSGGSGPAFAVADFAASVALNEYPTATTVSPDVLRRAAGVFEYRQQRAGRTFQTRMTLAVVDHQLRVTSNTGSGFEFLRGPLLPISDSTFFGQYAPALRFQIDAAPEGSVQRIVVRNINYGWRFDFRRVGR